MQSGLYQYWSTIEIVIKLLMAMFCGGAIGFERELSRKAAGLRTNLDLHGSSAVHDCLSPYQWWGCIH